MQSDLKTRILSYDRQVPRYTSYPTAPHFEAMDDAQPYHAALAQLSPTATLSLYVHIPFCQKMCWYCGCHTKVTERYAPVEDYLHLMLREIDILGEHITPTQQVTHVHFGGGSPTMLRGVDFSKFMEKIKTVFTFAPDAEIAMEIDPRGVTESRVAAYAKAGINRVSLGVQDFNDTVMAAVNRVQPYSVTHDAVTLLRSYGISKINMDFMYGLPYQTVESFGQSIDMIKILEPDRLSVFGYAHVPWLKKHMTLLKEQDLPDNALRYDLASVAHEKLSALGYVPIGIDHYARAGDDMIAARDSKTLRRNFQGYTTDNADALLGIGASSIGKLPSGFVQNAVAMPHYKERILNGQLSAMKYKDISPDDALRAAVIEQIMCYFECDIAATCQKYGVASDYFACEMANLEPYIADGFLSLSPNGNCITLNPDARSMVRIIASTFDVYLPAASSNIPRHARAV